MRVLAYSSPQISFLQEALKGFYLKNLLPWTVAGLLCQRTLGPTLHWRAPLPPPHHFPFQNGSYVAVYIVIYNA